MLRSAAMTLRYLQYLLWILPVPIFVCIGVMMLRRKLHARLPLFLAYVLFQVVDFAVGFLIYHRFPTQYFYAYWATTLVSVGLGFGVIYEVFAEVFRPFPGLHELGRNLFKWATLVMVLAAIVLAVANGPSDRPPVLIALAMLGRSIRVMQCGMVLLMLLCSSYLGLEWRHRIVGITFGFGIIAAVDLVITSLMPVLGLKAGPVLSLVKMSAYLFATCLWAAYILAPEPERKPVPQLTKADQWNFALASALHPGGSGPALPLIENAVERIFEKSNGRRPPSIGGD